jgi:hypothetical protein
VVIQLGWDSIKKDEDTQGDGERRRAYPIAV